MKNVLIAATLTATAATALAWNDSYYSSRSAAPVVSSEPVVVQETVVTSEPTRGVVIAEEPRYVPQPRITIEQRRLSLDERIQSDVMDAVMHAPNVTGKIGVESRDAAVTLTGWTATAGQARRVERVAHGISGIRSIDNQIRPRVGSI